MNKIIKKDPCIYCAQGPEQLQATSDGVLSGFDFAFKDLFDVQGYVTGAGNPAWLDSHSPAGHSSTLIEALLANGANCVGRVQTDELAYSLNGQNIHYGTPINPKAPDCIPGGSSSGSAVTVAKGDADFSIGTDTGGSVRVPASYCGLFGLRPTLGKLDLKHCFKLSKSFDTAGVFSRDLSVTGSVFSVLSGQTLTGTVAKNINIDNEMVKRMSAQRFSELEKWSEASGIKLLRTDLLAQGDYQLDTLSLLFRTIQGYEIIQQHDAWLVDHGESLDAAIMARVDWSRTINQEQYLQCKTKQIEFQNYISTKFKQLDGLWVLPTTPSGPPALTLDGEQLAEYRSQLMGLTSIAGLSGFPQLHLPMLGLDEGPCGISLLAGADCEADLIATGQCLVSAMQKVNQQGVNQ